MKSNSVNKGKLNWEAITKVAMDSVWNKQSVMQARTVVQQVIGKLEDSHSRFVPEEVVRAYTKRYQDQGMSFPFPKDSLIAKSLA